jgi:hypothetical protein
MGKAVIARNDRASKTTLEQDAECPRNRFVCRPEYVHDRLRLAPTRNTSMIVATRRGF